MKRHGSDFRNKSDRVPVGEWLSEGVWYRSPLWGSDHLVGRLAMYYVEQLSWCGRPLGVARDWDSTELGGLWKSTRTSAHCGPCKTAEETYNATI